MDKYTIIKLKKQGYSNRNVAKLIGINRKTVAKYWNEYKAKMEELANPNASKTEIQEALCEAPSYDSSSRKSRKYSDEIDKLVDEILESEIEKSKILGNHKQQLTQKQIHQAVIDAGFEISLSTISNKVREKRKKAKECFIKQTYDLGDRLEYDFGEVKLVIDGIAATYHMAVLSSPAANFRWAYLYKNQKKDVFMDSHVKFFEMVGGVYKEIVYDNMRNVVSKFLGRNEKELNEELVKMALYYGFDINVTNCFSGNEKGHVEGSVKIIRNHVFATNYKFKTFADASEYLNSQLIKMNETSNIKEEKNNLLPYKPKLELARISSQKVNKYSFIQVEKNFYSVPEYLVDKEVTAKIYFDKVCIYANNSLVCEHKKIDGINEISIDIRHYLNSLIKKPGALKNSLALKSIPKLKTIYDKYFNTKSKEFIDILQKNNEKSLDDLLRILENLKSGLNNVVLLENIADEDKINRKTQKQICKYNELCFKEAK